MLAAVHSSYYAQPRERVEELVRRAVKESPAGRELAEALLGLLEGSGPVWTSPAVPVLTRRPHAARYLGCSNFTAAQIVEAQWAAERIGGTPFARQSRRTRNAATCGVLPP